MKKSVMKIVVLTLAVLITLSAPLAAFAESGGPLNNDQAEENGLLLERDPVEENILTAAGDADETESENDQPHTHTPGDWEITPASFDDDGVMRKLCTECDEVLEEQIIDRVQTAEIDENVFTYSGTSIEPQVFVKDVNDNSLVEGEDFTVQYVNSNAVGTAKATVSLQGMYTGSKTISYRILSDRLKKISVNIGETKEVYIDNDIKELLGADIRYSIDNSDIATVNENGVVTGKSKGTTVVTVTAGSCTFRSTVNVFDIKGSRETISSGFLYYDYVNEDDIWDECDADLYFDCYDINADYFLVFSNEYGKFYKSIDISRFSLGEYENVVPRMRIDGKTYFLDKDILVKGARYYIDIRIDSDDYYKDYGCEYELIKQYPPEMITIDEYEYHLTMTDKTKVGYTSDGDATYYVTWQSSNTDIATVSKDGTVTAKKPGTCTITASLPNGAYDECTVIVSQHPNVNIKESKVTITGLGTKKLTIDRQNAIYDKIVWKSSNTRVATVDANGKVTAKKAGTAKITASIPGSSDTCTVTVNAVLKKKAVSVFYKRKYTNKLIAAPGKVTWSSSNKKIATVSSKGVIYGKKPGKCVITAKCNGKKYTCKVTIKQIALSYKSIELYRGEKWKINVYGGSGKIKWTTSNKKVATVSKSGVVKGVNPGKCTITMKRNGYTKKCKVTVYRQLPNFGAFLYDYDTRNNKFVVRIKNLGSKTLTINSGIKVEDKDYKRYDRKIYLNKKVKIKPGQSKTVYFKVSGSVTWYKSSDFTLMYYFTYDGAKYRGHTWDEDSVFKWGKKGWYATYDDEEWYENWYW